MSHRHRWQRFWYRFSYRSELCGISVGIWAPAPKTERALALEKTEAALRLIRARTPRGYSALKSDVQSILVAGNPTFRGQFLSELRMVELYDDDTTDSETSVEELACTLVHEAQHARLFRLGFEYEESLRGRIERICFRKV